MPRRQCPTCQTHHRVTAVPTDSETLCPQCGSPLAPVVPAAQLLGLPAVPRTSADPAPGALSVDPEHAFLARRQRQLDRDAARRDALAAPAGDDPADAIAVSLPLPRP